MKNRSVWMAIVCLFLSAAVFCAEEENEVKVKFADCPAAVQKTITEQAGGVKVEIVDKETGKDGKVVYEVDVVNGGKNFEVKINADGSLIAKKEDKDDEKDEKKEEKAKSRK